MKKNKKNIISTSDRATLKLAVLAKEKESVRGKLAVVAKQLATTAKEKESIRIKLAVTAREKETVRRKLVVTAQKLAKTAKEKEYVRSKLAVVAKQLAVTAREKESVRRKLVVTARKKEDIRSKLAIVAQKFATTAAEKEEARQKLAITAKELAATAVEKEEVRQKLVVTTDKLAREEKLAVIGKLAGIMGHEIRNPLGVIRNSIYFLNMKFKENIDEKVKRHMDIMETEIVAADKIISDVLDFARTKPPSLVISEINSVIQAVLSTANIPKTIKVQTDLGENLPRLTIDIAQVKQVFSNLISNAIEAMPEGGGLRVTTSQIDSFISIAFKDTGVGILKENINKLFTPLFSTKTKGLGLGLAACQNIIIAHQGKIEFKSKENQGTTFIIKLPLAPKVDTGQEKLKN